MRRRVYTTSITDVGSAGALQYALGGPPSKRKARVLASTHIDDFASRRAYRMYQQASSYVETCPYDKDRRTRVCSVAAVCAGRAPYYGKVRSSGLHLHRRSRH